MGTRFLYASTTNDSIAFGEGAGANFNSGTNYNIALGFQAGQNASSSGADYNNYMGYQAGQNNTGSRNNLFGERAGSSNTGSYNNLFGYQAGRYNTGSSNNLFGGYAGQNNTGSRNNLFGSSAGQYNTGSNNNIFGQEAGQNNTGSDNNLFGPYAGLNNTGSYSEFIGFETGARMSASSTVAIGGLALRGGSGNPFGGLNATTTNNTVIGYRAGFNVLTGGDNNLLLGYQTADNLTTGANNIVLGYDIDVQSATQSNTLNVGNLLFGTGIDGTGTTLASGNIGIGTSTPSSKLTVAGSGYFGGALRATGAVQFDSLTSGLLFANGAGVLSAFATSSLGLGDGTLDGLTDVDTTGVTNGSLLSYDGSAWVDVATSSLGISGSLFTDSGANTYLTSLTDNLGIGTSSPNAKLTVAGDINIASPASGLSFMGTRFLYASTTNDSVAFGEGAGENFTASTNYNVALGFQAGQNASTTFADNNNYIGRNAGQNNTGSNNNLFGSQAGQNNTGSQNNLFGLGAGFSNTGWDNNLFGGSAGADNTGSNNNLFGDSAGRFNTGSRNNLFGSVTGYNNTGSDNNIFGADAGNDNTGSGNNFFGRFAGYSNTGSYSEFIGFETGARMSASSTVAIGGLALRGGSGSPFSGLNATTTNNTVIGYGAGYSVLTGGDNNLLLGYQTADNLTTGANNIVLGYDIDVQSATQSNTLNVGNLLFGTGIDGTGTTLASGNIGIGTSTPSSKLTVANTGFSGAGVVGLDQYLQTTNSVASAVQFGNRFQLEADNTATTTLVGSMYRVADNTTFGNTVRGLEVQTNRGSNTLGENTALSGFARTFGVRGVTSGDAGGSFEPAGGFFESEGTAQGNAIRGYSETITSATLLSLFQDSSAFTGTGLEMNFGNTAGSFSSSTSKYLDFQNAGTSVFTVSAFGTTTIGDGTTNNMAGLQIGYGGICVDNDGTCVASTTGNITAVSYGTANSDLAENYFSSQSLETGEIVTLAGGLSVARAEKDSTLPVLGVVSTKPGLTLGFDDTSLQAGENAYPIALSGRVPVQLSTENGPIKKGDQLMLSSLPGVAMKATGTGATIGIALEDFTESRMYSDTYLNQFGDDMVDPVYEPIVSNTDERINDGCYYGGGNAAGEEECAPLVATTSAAQIAEANNRLAEDSVAEQLDALKRVNAHSRTLANGQSVKVGQVVMFVQSGHRWVDESQLASMNSLFSTSTLSEIGENENQTLFDRLVTLANSFVDGVFSIFELRADRIEVANELCVDGVCVSGDDLRALLEAANTDGQTVEVTETSTETPDADAAESESDPSPETGSGTASSTEESPDDGTTATTTEPVATSTVATSTASTTQPVTDEEGAASTTAPMSDEPITETESEATEEEEVDEPEVIEEETEEPVAETEPEETEPEAEADGGGAESGPDTEV